MKNYHILYVDIAFFTPEEGGIIRAYHLAEALAREGHTVTVFTRQRPPLNSYETRTMAGFTVHYLPFHYQQDFGTFRRLWAYAMYPLMAFWYASKLKKIDRCYIASVPLTIGFLGLMLKKIRNIPFDFDVGDLWPQTPIEMGYFNSKFIQKLLYKLEAKIYQEADRIIGKSPWIKADIQKRIAHPEKVFNIPNLSDCDFFHAKPKIPALEKHWDVEDRFVIAYLGAVGKVVVLEQFLLMADYCQRNPKLLFLLVGSGSELVQHKAEAQRLGLKNLRFIDKVSKYEVADILNITDVLYLSYMNIPALRANSPNKLFDALAAGVPSAINIRGWHCDLLETHQAGFYAPQNKPEAFLAQIEDLIADPSLYETYARNARNLAETQFNKRKLTQKFVSLFSTQPELVLN